MLRAMGRALRIIAVVVVVAAAGLFLPYAPHGLRSHPEPAHTYETGLALARELSADDSPEIAADCRTELLTHGRRTAHVVVLLHGLTNCPAQFDSLAHMLFARGDNVLVPRLPHHGYADRMTDELARVDAQELCVFTDRAIDAASGLGDTVTVAGLSVGGVMTAWAGQERADVDRAVVIAPMLGWARAPGAWRTRALTRLALLLPNRFVWWDDTKKQALDGPRHVYPRFASRSVAATMWLGSAVLDRAAHHEPAARSLVMITVGGDIAADNGLAADLAESWRKHGAPELLAHEFPAALRLNHDVVDPEQVGGNPALTYPVLLKFIGR